MYLMLAVCCKDPVLGSHHWRPFWGWEYPALPVLSSTTVHASCTPGSLAPC